MPKASKKITIELTESRLIKLMKAYTKELLRKAGSEGLEYMQMEEAESFYPNSKIYTVLAIGELARKGEIVEFQPAGSVNKRYRLKSEVSRRFFYKLKTDVQPNIHIETGTNP